MKFKLLQDAIIASYRTAAIVVLLTVITGVASYLSLLVFYAVSDSWAAPIRLSPSHEKVLAIQPQVATIEASLLNQRTALMKAVDEQDLLKRSTGDVSDTVNQLATAINADAAAMNVTSAALGDVIKEKEAVVREADKAVAAARDLLLSSEKELAAGLITQDVAAARRLTAQSAITAAADLKASLAQLKYQQSQLSRGASASKGSGKSVQGVQLVQQQKELDTTLVASNAQSLLLEETINALRSTIVEQERLLAVAKQSPFFRARSEIVHVAFVPYSNLKSMQVGDKVYDCLLQVVICSEVGKVTRIYDAEDYARHPLFKTDLKGQLVELELSDKTASFSQVIFIGGRPLFL